ncbi:hypothetical protein GYMLUDRAFT_63615 [Collybiopsis luxurians FD-317 M1]|uniref:Uncharacterized protein n=1 Tax=Collybiopsis luxurians FD-317 M1 TaxID=944289 RepID=A0A0D0AT71_9AGAR|nr:hypothetical protein GYMLUDRAFT_63615 [Collybiopsis luxurians FD-317 M1]
MEELIGILESHNVYSFMDPPKSMTDSEVAAFLAKASEFEDCRHYSYLLAYLNTHDSHYCSAYSLYIPMNSLVLPTTVQSHRHYTFDEWTYHCKKSIESSSHIYHYIPGAGSGTSTGCIIHIWQVPLENTMRMFFFVCKHQPLPVNQQQWNPYSKFPCNLLCTEHVLQALSPSFYIIEPQHIICHLAAHKLPKPG